MKIVVIGAGHIGLVTALSFTHLGHDVLCLDVNQQKIKLLSDAITEIYEPGLQQLLQKSLLEKKIDFSTDYKKASSYADIIFMAVGTPNTEYGCDLHFLDTALASLRDSASFKPNEPKKIIVIKSTVTPGTLNRLQSAFPHFNFVSCPEFLREGQALQDALHPERVIAGSESAMALRLVKEIYLPFLKDADDFITMDSISAEMTKYAANSFLAAKISLTNEFSRLCEKVGANIESVTQGIGKDSRIGNFFLKAGIGYGGSCLPKDIDALLKFAEAQNEKMEIIRSVKSGNTLQIDFFISKISKAFKFIDQKTVTLWGAAFKPETNDIREAPSLTVIGELLKLNFKITIYDPVANQNIINFFKLHPRFDRLRFCDDRLEALETSNALIILTEWSEFFETDLQEIKKRLSTFMIFDGRNVFASQYKNHSDLKYFGMGL